MHRAILDAARELFVQQGFAAVSLRKIAERIEYSPTAIYLYFKDKNEILAALIQEGFELLCSQMQQNHVEDPVERLRQGARCYFAFAQNYPHYYALMFELCDDDFKEAIGPKSEAGLMAFNFIRTAVIQAMESGQFRTDQPELVVSHTIWAHIHGAAALALAHRLTMLPEEHHAAFFESVAEASLRGFAKS